MTKKILLALALTLGTASVAVPNASACGSYGPPESAETREVRETVEAFSRRQLRGTNAYVWAVELDGDRAVARFSWARSDGQAEAREARLRLRNGAWRIVSVRVG